jgi:shikimate kinase
MEKPIWLVGMMGSGKTTVAPLVAASLGRDVVDMDLLIERRTGLSIEELFGESEARFRAEEVEAVRELATGGAVVASGGGAVLTEAAKIMRDSGTVVWLKASVATLADRVDDGVRRPLLTGGPLVLEHIDRQRRDRYRETAHAVVDTDGRSPRQVADLVVEAWTNASSEV